MRVCAVNFGHPLQAILLIVAFSRGGTSGCVLAGRLAENIDARILLIEAGPESANLENVHMVGGWVKIFSLQFVCFVGLTETSQS
jgi:hypothetical protein